MAPVERIVTAFPRDGEELVGEWPLTDIELEELQAMFDRPADDPMYDAYEVQPQHVERLERAIGEKLDLARFEYFVEAVALDGSCAATDPGAEAGRTHLRVRLGPRPSRSSTP